DWWTITVPQGNELALSLSNLPADYDLSLFSPVVTPLQAASQQAPSVSDAVPTASSNVQPPAGGNEVDVTAPDGYQLYAVSANRGTNDETIQTPPLAAGQYLVHVNAFNNAWSNQPYVLRASELATPTAECTISYPNAQPGPQSLPGSYPSGVNTV